IGSLFRLLVSIRIPRCLGSAGASPYHTRLVGREAPAEPMLNRRLTASRRNESTHRLVVPAFVLDPDPKMFGLGGSLALPHAPGRARGSCRAHAQSTTHRLAT